MNSVVSSLIKNGLLVALVTMTLLYALTPFLSQQELLITQCVLGILYLSFSCYDALSLAAKSKLELNRFAYFPHSYFTKLIITTIIYLTIAYMLWLSKGTIKYLAIVCCVVATSNVLVAVINYTKQLYIVSFGDNYILRVGGSNSEKLFASEISHIEYRHNILYMVKKDKKTSMIDLAFVKQQKEIIATINEWTAKNGVVVSEESSARLKNVIV